MKQTAIKSILSFVLLLFSLTVNASERKFLEGQVANSTVGIDLFILDGNEATGSLYYERNRKRISEDIVINGSWYYLSNGNIEIILTETTRGGKYCGRWKLNYNRITKRATGTVTNSKNKTFRVNLKVY